MKVYLDTFSGLIAGVLIERGEKESKVKVTVTKKGYKKSEVVTTTNGHIIPRNLVRVRCGQYRILGDLSQR